MQAIRDRKSVSAEELRRQFTYDPETGKIHRKSSTCDEALWSEAFCRQYGGYLEGNYASLSFAAHRVAWALCHGDWPDGMIDHINGDGCDNRLCNLRVVNNVENCRNLGLRKRKTGPDSGVNGVYWHKQSRKWMVRIKTKGQWLYFGTYSDLAEATKVRRDAEKLHGFHPNHGRRPAKEKRVTLSLFI